MLRNLTTVTAIAVLTLSLLNLVEHYSEAADRLNNQHTTTLELAQ